MTDLTIRAGTVHDTLAMGEDQGVTDLITDALVDLDARFGDDPDAVIRGLAELVGAAGRTGDTDTLTRDVGERESSSLTGLPGGFAVPHARSSAVTEPVLAFARLAKPVDFGAKDRGATLVFLIVAPTDGASVHLSVLSALAKALARPSFGHSLRRAETGEEAVEVIRAAVGKVATS